MTNEIKVSDSKKKSISEAIANIIPGFWINNAANVAILPLYAGDFGSGDAHRIFVASMYVGIWFTVISVARQYLLRRAFNKLGPNENFFTLCVRVYKFLKNRKAQA